MNKKPTYSFEKNVLFNSNCHDHWIIWPWNTTKVTPSSHYMFLYLHIDTISSQTIGWLSFSCFQYDKIYPSACTIFIYYFACMVGHGVWTVVVLLGEPGFIYSKNDLFGDIFERY